MRQVVSIAGLLLVLPGAIQPTSAAEVYRWIGEDGVVHYSDEKPRDDASFTTMQFAESRPQEYDPHKDPYSIENQAKRINESWSQLAQVRAERVEQLEQASQNSVLASQNQLQQRRNFGPRYFSPWFNSNLVPLNFQRRIDPRAASRQQQAIDGLNLSGQRPASINSGAHRERVQRSGALPISQSSQRVIR